MRIIGGDAKRKRLISYNDIARPTASRIKETLFNLVGNVKGLYFLDLYAGTGNIGIEAISRGAEAVCFVEKAPELCKIIRKNLKTTGFEERGRIFRHQVTGSLFKLFKKKLFIFDIVFADPPYESGQISRLMNCIDFSIIDREGIFVVQHSVREKIKKRANRVVKIGDTLLSIFERQSYV